MRKMNFEALRRKPMLYNDKFYDVVKFKDVYLMTKPCSFKPFSFKNMFIIWAIK